MNGGTCTCDSKGHSRRCPIHAALASPPQIAQPESDRIYELEKKIRAADAVMEAIDRVVEAGLMDSRSEIADRRLDYSQPYTYAAQPLQVSAEQQSQANFSQLKICLETLLKQWPYCEKSTIQMAIRAALAATPPQPPSVEIDAFLQEHRDVLQLLFDNDISIGKAIEALRELQEGKVPLLPQVRDAEAAPPLVEPQE